MSNPISSMFSSVLPSKLQTSNRTEPAVAKAVTTPQTAEDKFMAYAKMSPADKLRAGILSGLGITEDQVKNMSPDQRKDVEQKIADQIKQAAQKQAQKSGNGGFFTDIQA